MRTVFYAIGAILLGLSAAMTAPLIVALLSGGEGVFAFIAGAVATAAAGGALLLLCRGEGEMTLRGSFFLVTFAWAAVGAFGAIPFWLHGAIPAYTDAFFETVSGFTTTGATILSAQAVEALPKSLHIWRALIQWLGGMGIIVLSVALLPIMHGGGFKVFQAEVPGLVKERLLPRIGETAKILWGLYALITAAEAILLWLGGMSVFDAILHSLTTLATGGFSNKGGSIGQYGSLYIELVIVFFMFLAGTNFLLHYRAMTGVSIRGYWRDEEFHFYGMMVGAAVLLVTLNLWWTGGLEAGASLRQALFQTVSIVSTTGYATADFGSWPALSQIVLLGLMLVGACGGSTGGAMKQARILILFRTAKAQLRKSLHPQAVIPVHLNGHVIEESVLGRVQAFFILYLGISAALVALCASFGMDIMTAISAVAATVGNIGPGLARVGPTFDYGALPGVVKWALGGGMIVGRLEVFTVLVLFQPAFWKRWG